jgi:hypothetical protein
VAVQNKKNKKKSEFKTASDGRHIITEDNSSSEEEHANAFDSGKLSAF